MDRGLGIAQKVHGVMIAAAAQEGEEIAAPIGNAKAQHIAIELHDAGNVGTLIGDVTELERHDAGEGVVVRRESAVGEDFERGAFGILKRQRFANARRDVVTPFALDPGFVQACGDICKVAAGRDLKR